MGIRPEKSLHGPTLLALNHQQYVNDMKFDYINRSISSPANDNNCSNKHKSKNSRSVKHDTDMVNRSHHHLRLADSLNSIGFNDISSKY